MLPEKPLVASILVSFALATGCSGAPADEDTTDADMAAASAEDLPWEVSNGRGETYLPDVFYAEASENEQVMPVKIHGRYQIDRLVYPTLGNPNLYVRNDPKDEVMVVLRIEENILSHLSPKLDTPIEGRWLRAGALTEDAQNALAFYAVDKQGRAASEGGGVARAGEHVLRIKPNAIFVHPLDEQMPEPFKKRRTVRVVFNRKAMANVPAGFYDVRMEVLHNGQIRNGAYEYQYNALRVFDSATDEYTIVNVTDTQVSVADSFAGKTLERLKQFVQRVNASTDDEVRRAAFISFNGDLHNGGAPDLLSPGYVATNYNSEAAAILDTLKELRLPIFLTLGNHDGYVAMGRPVPGFDGPIAWFKGIDLKKTVLESQPGEWPDFNWYTFEKWLDDISDQPGGRHVDIFEGSHVRRVGTTWDTWQPVPRDHRNMVLYDGVYQWRRTYGPLYMSWGFGKNHYVNMDSYQLRQHRRSGWGMYTVNYGGGVSRVQSAWVGRELDRAEQAKKDIVLISHHDPRGGHEGKDHPYYYGLIDYKVGLATAKYIIGEVLNPILCTHVPDWVRVTSRKLSCLHDGLQEWMRADDEFDCEDKYRMPTGRCDASQYNPNAPADEKRHPWFSGYAILHKLSTRPSLRTFLLGHTHYNSFEMLQAGDEIVPEKVGLDSDQAAALEAENPVRAGSLTNDSEKLTKEGLVREHEKWLQNLNAAGHDFQRALPHGENGSARELMFLRMTSNADLTSQKYMGKSMMGFAALTISRVDDARKYTRPQINAVTFFLNDQGSFEVAHRVAFDRTRRMSPDDAYNPVNSLFTF